MAEGFARAYLRGANVWSAGSEPEGYVHPLAVRVMDEVGIDIRGQTSKHINDLPEIPWDVVVVVCSPQECPALPGKTLEVWNVPDPFGESVETYREVRDVIREKVKDLARRLQGRGETS